MTRTAAGRDHYVDADATRGGKGSGRPRGKGNGELDPYRPHEPESEEFTTGTDPDAERFDPKTSKRVGSKATATSDVYDYADGSQTRKLYGRGVNYRAADGSWRPIDPTLVKRGDGRLHMAANSLRVSVAGPPSGTKAAHGSELASMTLPSGQNVTYGLAGAAPVAPTVDGGTATYRDILPHTDLELSTFDAGLKETLVLKSAEAGSSWVFPLRLEGLTPRLADDGGVELLDASGKAVAWFPAGYMEDSNVDPKSGAPQQSSAVRFELITVDGAPALKVSADEAWLRDPARVYPVRVDPTATTGTTGDVYLDNYSGTTNHNTHDLPVGTYNGGSVKARSFIHLDSFDNDGFLGRKISSAKLKLYLTWAYSCTTHRAFNVHKVTQGWSVADLSTAAPSRFPGPSISSSIGSLTVTDNYPACQNTSGNRSTGKWVTVTLNPATFNDWSAGGTNHGLALTASESDSYGWKRFTAANYSSGAYKPYVELTYTDNVTPQVDVQFPPNNHAATTLTPELMARGSDGDKWPNASVQYLFTLYNSSGTKIKDSGRISSGSWTVPAGTLKWSENYIWTVQTWDGYTYSQPAPYRMLSTPVPQPLVTSRLAQNANGRGFEPSVGNYTTSATDAEVATVGPALSVERSYNSRDPRSAAAFGAGWSTVFDAKATEEPAGSPSTVVVTYPNGQQVAFGRNGDGSFTPPSGRFATFVAVSGGGYSLTDKNGTVYRFTQSAGSGVYGITSITDAAGRALSFAYADGRVSKATSASGRSLTFGWATPQGASAAHVITVSTDPVTAGDAGSALTWGYTYTGDRLVKVCPPTSATACTTYGYQDGSQYSTALLDAGPHSYWRLGEASGAATAASVVLANQGTDSAVYSNVTLGQSPALPGSTATSASFDGSSSSVKLPPALVNDASYQSVSLWFKTTTADRVLFSYQAGTVSGGATTSGNYTPSLYVGSDGKLRGQFWYSGGVNPIVTPAAVTDGNWHQVVLTAAGNTQSLYLDGALVGSRSGLVQLFQPNGSANVYVGAGFIGGGWPNQSRYSTSSNTGYASFFNGSISDVAFFDKALTAPVVAQTHAAGRSSGPLLTSVTRPSGKKFAQVSYDTTTSTVAQVTDANGGVWKVGAPAVSGSSQVYAGAVLGGAPADYWRLSDAAGSTAANQVNGGTATYNSVTLGGAGPFTDATAASFNGTSSYLRLPGSAIPGSSPQSVGLWFKMPSGSTKGGVLFGYQTAAITDDPAASPTYVPALYVGTDGKLRGYFWMGSSSNAITSSGKVNDGKWHQVVLAASGDSQSLYLDGARVGSPLSGTRNPSSAAYAYIGAGKWSNWPGTSGTVGYFPGSISDVAIYRSQLSDAQVAQQWAASKSAEGLTPVTTVEVTDPGNKTISYVYDTLTGNRLVAQTDALGHTTRYGYDTGGFVHTLTDPNGNVTTMGHDVRGNTVSYTTCQFLAGNKCSTTYYTHYPNNTSKTLAPDPRNDQVLTVRDPRSSSATDNTYLTTYAYDAKGNLTSVTTPPVSGHASGRTATFTYTDGTTVAAADGGFAPPGLAATSTSPGGALQSVTYFASGDVARVTDPAGLVTEFTYDSLGRLLTEKVVSDTYPDGLVTSHVYDGLDRVVEETAPPVTNRVTGAIHTAKTTNVYDADGNVTSRTVVDTTGGDASRTVSMTYNGHNQVASSTDPSGNTTTYAYDAYGNKVSVVDPAANEVIYAYDANGRLLTTTHRGATWYPNNPTTPANLVLESRAYDPAGRLASVTDAMGWVTELRYSDDGLFRYAERYGPSGESFVIEENYYDAAGNIVERSTNHGATETTFTVDAAGRTTKAVLDPSGLARETTYSYSPDDAVLSTTLSDGGSTSLTTEATYDPLGRMRTRTVHNGSAELTTTWTLDKRGLPTAMTDPLGHTTNYTNDEAGRQVVIVAPTVNTETGGGAPVATRPITTIGYDTFGAQTELADPNGNVTTIGYDANGRAVSQTLPGYTPPGSSTPITATMTQTLDSLGQVTSVTDPLGNTTAYTYDQLGNVVTVHAPNGSLTRYTYTALGQPLSVTDPTGAVTEATYDYLGRMLTTTQVVRQPSPSARTTTYEYNSAGLLSSATTPAGLTTSYTYNAAGENTKVTDPAGNATTYGFDLAGRPVSTTLADGTRTTATYDGAGNLTAVKELDAAGSVLATRTAGYDAGGNLTSITDPLGTTKTLGYDATGMVTSLVEPVTATTSITSTFGYDAAGNRTRFTDGRGNRFITTYNRWNLPESQIEPATTAFPNAADRTFTSTYDAAGRVVTETSPGGVVVSNTYDSLGNLTGQTGTGADAPTVARSFGYDSAGRLVSASAPGGTNTFTYDDRDLLLSATGPSGDSSFAYTADGLMASRTDAAGTSSYGYDSGGRLSTLTDAATGTQLAYTYNSLNQVSKITYGGANARSFGYDDRHRLTSDTLKTPGGATIASITYGYDANGDLTSKTTTGFAGSSSNTYTYDRARRLTSWNNGTTTTNYGYDASGNRTQVGNKTYTYNERNQLTGDGTSSYSYTARGSLASIVTGGQTVTSTSDAFGQTITHGGQTYTYDALERMVTATTSGGPTTTLTYTDTENTVASDGSTSYSRDPDGNLVGVKTGTGSSLAWTDQHTDVVGLFTATGTALAGSTSYDPFGAVTATSNHTGNLGYQSGWTDPATSRVNMHARWYDPGTGQFSTRDSYDLSPLPTSANANRYLYTNNNPLIAKDPTGHLCEGAPEVCPIVVGAGVVVAAPAIIAVGTVVAAVVILSCLLFCLAGDSSPEQRRAAEPSRSPDRSSGVQDNPAPPKYRKGIVTTRPKGSGSPSGSGSNGGSSNGGYNPSGGGRQTATSGGAYNTPTNSHWFKPGPVARLIPGPGRPAPVIKSAPDKIAVPAGAINDGASGSSGGLESIEEQTERLRRYHFDHENNCYSSGFVRWDGTRVRQFQWCEDRPAARLGEGVPNLYRSDGDPMRELGAGLDTHPEEWSAHIRRAESLGVEVVYRSGGIAYAPGTRPGNPGQLIIDPDASISALRHEMSHLDDDLAVGWGGFQKAYDRDFMWASEFKAYMVEVSYARGLGRFDLSRRLISLARARKAELFGP